jgi:2'-5' RNA ligase
MRIFIGIDLDPEVRMRITRFMDGIQGFVPEVRWVRPESLHITLKFIGEQLPERVNAMAGSLRKIEAPAFEVNFSGYGFFPTAKAPRVFWIGIHAEPQLAGLAESIDKVAAELGIPPEEHAYSPHLTLARGGRKSSGSPKWRSGDGPNRMFAELQKRLSEMSDLDFGTMMVREFILYRSQLSAGGSKYTKLHSFPLWGVSEQTAAQQSI